MSYAVHEIFLTQQGEGANLGRTAVFVRFAGCNLWSGREEDRADAVCRFCDTDFLGHFRADASSIVETAAGLWPEGEEHRFVVMTGGEPLLQVDRSLVAAFAAAGFRTALETNGTRPLPCPVDWVAVSPKANAPVVLREANELRLVFPQDGIDPAEFLGFRAEHFWISPMDGPGRAENMQAAAAYCRDHPRWRLNIQAHKTWGVA